MKKEEMRKEMSNILNSMDTTKIRERKRRLHSRYSVCEVCGIELEPLWEYCINCGAKVNKKGG